MTVDNETIENAPDGQIYGSNYERSSIAFPYFDLSECLKIVRAISNNAGAAECTDDQIAAWIDLSPKSSGYRSRMSASRLFGLIENRAENGHRISELGLKALDDHHARAAKVAAFLNVPLFKRVFENWQGQQVPPAAALERALVTFGVAEKQKARARQTLERSAAEANFYEHGRDRLVKPGIKNREQAEVPPSEPPNGRGFGGGGEGTSRLDPIIQGLINRLPKVGDVWSKPERKLWLEILENSFELVYRDSDHPKNPQLPSQNSGEPVG